MTPTRARLLVLAIILTALGPVAGRAQAAPARAAFGVQIITVDRGVDPARIDADLDVAHQVGATLVRVGIPWSSIEPQASGQRDPEVLALADHTMRAAADRGLRAVLVMTSTPCWASAAPAAVRGDCSGAGANRTDVTRYPPRVTAPYVALSTFMAKRYGRALAAFEVWNEPDQSNEKYWAGPNKVARYVRLAKALYRPLKRANPQMKVLAGAFTSYNGRWLRALYAAGIRGSYDALSMHLYGEPLYGLRYNRAVQLAHHDTKPVWLAETGWTSCAPARTSPEGHVCVDRPTQGALLSDLVTSLRARPRFVQAMLDYKVTDDNDTFAQFGLVDTARAPKPAFSALFDALRPRRLAPRPVRLSLRSQGGRIVASGSGPGADAYTLRAVVNGRLRYQRSFYLTAQGTYRVTLPAVLGTTMAVTVKQPWLGRSAQKSIGTG